MKYTDIVKRSADRINNLISDLLNSTKLAQPELITYPIEEVLEDAISHFGSDRISWKIFALPKSVLIKLTPSASTGKTKDRIREYHFQCGRSNGWSERSQAGASCGGFEKDHALITITDNGREWMKMPWTPFSKHSLQDVMENGTRYDSGMEHHYAAWRKDHYAKCTGRRHQLYDLHPSKKYGESPMAPKAQQTA